MAYSILLGGSRFHVSSCGLGGGGRNRDRGLQQMRQTDGALSECTLIFIIY